MTADKVLVSTGRHPALEGLGLESVGLGPDSTAGSTWPQTITGLVQARLADEPWLYAVGDAAGRNLFTHQGKYGARATGDAISARANGN